MTYNELIASSLRLLGVVSSGNTIDGTEYVDAMQSLNLMMAGLRLEGVDLNWQEVSSASGGSTMPFPLEDLDALRPILAMYLAPEYGKGNNPPQIVVSMAANGMQNLWSKYNPTKPLEFDKALLPLTNNGAVNRTLFT